MNGHAWNGSFFFEEGVSLHTRIRSEADRYVQRVIVEPAPSSLNIYIGLSRVKRLWMPAGLFQLYGKVKAMIEPMPAVVFLQAILQHPLIQSIRRPIQLRVHFTMLQDEAYLKAFETFNSGFFGPSSPFGVQSVGIDFGMHEKSLFTIGTFLSSPFCRIRTLSIERISWRWEDPVVLEKQLDCLFHARSIEELHYDVGTLGIEIVAKGLGRRICLSPNIKSLKLRIWEDCLPAFVTGLTSAGENRLQHLQLSIQYYRERAGMEAYSHFEEVVADTIDALLRSKHLLSLALICVELLGENKGDRIRHALGYLSSSPLQSLSLPWSPSDASVLHLIQILTRGANLRELELGGPLSFASFAALLAASPRCNLDVVRCRWQPSWEPDSAAPIVSALRRSTLAVVGLPAYSTRQLPPELRLGGVVTDAAAANPWLCHGFLPVATLDYARRRQWATANGVGPAYVSVAAERMRVARTILHCGRLLLLAKTSFPPTSPATVPVDRRRPLPRVVWELVVEALMSGWFLPRDIADVVVAMGDRRSIGRLLRCSDWYGHMGERAFVWRCAAFREAVKEEP
ncbi:hypothetical protein DFJ73DRAFT_370383 [Zopfochytrium polystomum]|nr:hypothetical protein DFJ73DRAFT_370383 [Zopfochytrium polystomum]